MNDPFRRATFGPALIYKDPAAALDWLETAFGFVRVMVITDQGGSIVHAEVKFGDGYLMIGSEWTDYAASPVSTGGKVTQLLHVRLEESVNAHCARARAAGAVIVREPTDEFYGDRVYSARDPEGHVWTFGQNVRFVSREEAEQATGLKIEGWPSPG